MSCLSRWCFPLFLLPLSVLRLTAQESPSTAAGIPVFPSARDAVATVVSRDAHSRVEQWVERLIAEDGTTNDVVHSVTVLANGMHYRDGESGEWRETNPEFTPVAGGWLAARGQHQTFVSEELFVAGAVTVISPEGALWKSTPMTLAVRDRSSGQVLVLGESRATRGELVAPNTVLYTNAFEGALNADVRVINFAGGIECDVILRTRLPSAEVLGVTAEASDVVVLTEIFETTAATHELVDRGGRSDDVVRLGALTMDQGKAFGTDDATGTTPERSVPVFKRVYQDEPTGRVFLEEATPLDSLAPLLDELPEASIPNASNSRWRDTALHEVGSRKSEVGGKLPPAPSLPRRADGRFEIAAAQPGAPNPELGTRNFELASASVSPVTRHPSLAAPGVVLDWSFLNSLNNAVLRGDSVFLITNAVTLGGTNVVFEGNVIFKFQAGSGASLSISSGVNIDWQGEAYRPVTFTAKDDNSIGDTIAGSTGNPSGTYAATALFLNGSGRTNGLLLTNLRVRHASCAVDAVYFGQNAPLTLRQAQFVNCAYPFKLQLGYTGADSYFLQNVLVTGATTLFKDCYYARTQAAFLTVDGATTWFASSYSPHYCTNTITDSILVATGSVNVGTTNNCWIASSGSGLFETVGAGAHYLSGQSPVRGVTATQSLAALDTSLASATTLAPLGLTNVITSDLTLTPWLGTNDGFTLGYHYAPADWYASNVVVTNATLTLTNGVNVLLGGTKGFQLDAGSKWVSTGSPLAPNRLVRASLVQEGTNGLTGSTFAAFTVGSGSPRPEITARFTHSLLPSESTGRRHWLDLASDRLALLRLTDCQFANVSLTLSPTASTEVQTAALTNNLFDGCRLYFYRYADHNLTVGFQNNLVRRGDCWASYYNQATQNPTWTVKDNLFDNASLLSGNTNVVGAYNGYTSASATFGGSGNKTSLVTDYVVGPLGRFYYPATGGSSSLTNLLDAGSVTNATLVNLYHHTTLTNGPREGTTRVDIGFHYAWASATGLADSDGDGLSDLAEDTDLDGVKDAGETDPSNADSDHDGALDGEELAAGTDPNSQGSWIPKRLAAWWWEGASWRNGDRGQTPSNTGTEVQTNGVVGSGVHFAASVNDPLRYPLLSTTGQMNARLDQGSIRLWFKPDYGWTNLMPNGAAFFEVGSLTNTTNWGWWSWTLGKETSTSSNYCFRLWQTNFQIYSTQLHPIEWETPRWHQLAMCYSSNSTNSTWLMHDGSVHFWVDASTNTHYTGHGIYPAYLPTAAGLSNGFALGADFTGAYPAKGAIDSLETFNYPLGTVETESNQQLTLQIVTNGATRRLQFERWYEGMPQDVHPVYVRPLSIYRRSPGSTNWGTALVTGSTNLTWTDTTAAVGTAYEYRADYVWGSQSFSRHFFAGIDLPPQHQRGNVILVVDSTLEPYLTNELALLKTNLIGDGWTVTNLLAARHNDTNWGVNTNNLPTLASNIVNAAKVGTTNVVFILGHVTIPYSGMGAPDGHDDHQYAWVADAYYGYLSKSGWTDTLNRTNGANTNVVNRAGDGLFDPDLLAGDSGNTNYPSVGRLPDMAVGRLDFARLPAFAGLTEVDLIKRYLAKDARYRAHGIPTFGRVSAHVGKSPEEGINIAQGFAGAAFGVEPGRVFNGFNLLDQVPADLGLHHMYGYDAQVDNGLGNDHFAAYFANPAKELPVTFRQVWFSYASDWARLDATNQFLVDNNWLRASLGWTNHGLATMGGLYWDFTVLGGGAPLASTMTYGWQSLPLISRFQSILGDPTLRLHRITPPSGPKASRSGTSVSLMWNPSTEANRGYYVYRSTNGLDGFTTPLNSVPTPALSYTDTTTSTNILYQVRAAKLQVTGSGSFTNLSQAIFISVP